MLPKVHAGRVQESQCLREQEVKMMDYASTIAVLVARQHSFPSKQFGADPTLSYSCRAVRFQTYRPWTSGFCPKRHHSLIEHPGDPVRALGE